VHIGDAGTPLAFVNRALEEILRNALTVFQLEPVGVYCAARDPVAV
jgi:hypothetical protein